MKKGEKKENALTRENLYHRYQDMKSRCFNSLCCNYKNYGARGITICQEWLGPGGYHNFRAWAIAHGYSKELSIDRIDNNGNYCPENCRWTTKSVQNMSRRHGNTSGYIGISLHSNKKFWYGRLKVNGKTIYTGMSKNIHEAAEMRNNYIIKHHLPNVINEVHAWI